MRTTPAIGVGLLSARNWVLLVYSGTTLPVSRAGGQMSTPGSHPIKRGVDQIGFAPSTMTTLVPFAYHVCSQSIARPIRPKNAEPPSPMPTIFLPESRMAAIAASAPGHAHPTRGSGIGQPAVLPASCAITMAAYGEKSCPDAAATVTGVTSKPRPLRNETNSSRAVVSAV